MTANDNGVTDLALWKMQKHTEEYFAEYQRLRPEFEALLGNSPAPWCFFAECIRQTVILAHKWELPLDDLIEHLRDEYEGMEPR